MPMKVSRVFLLTLCLFIPYLYARGQVKTDPTVNQIRHMKSAVVQIAYTSDAPTASSRPGGSPTPMPGLPVAGSGFFVSKGGYVLTAGHVVRGAEDGARAAGATRITLQVGITLDASFPDNTNMSGNFTFVDAALVEVDDIHDLALLKLSRNPFLGEVRNEIVLKGREGAPLRVTTASLDSQLPSEGESLLVSGYPLPQSIPTFVTQKGIVASVYLSAVDVRRPGGPADSESPQIVNVILLAAAVNPGNSGGPVYEPTSGRVVGICDAYMNSPLFTNKQHTVNVNPQESLTQNSGLAIVVPIQYAIELLRKNNVPGFPTAASHQKHPQP